MSRLDVANYLGLSLEAVSRALSRLERDGIIAFEGRRRVRVLDRTRRNLRQLDAIPDDPDVGSRWLARKDHNGVSLVVQVENDADHYAGAILTRG